MYFRNLRDWISEKFIRDAVQFLVGELTFNEVDERVIHTLWFALKAKCFDRSRDTRAARVHLSTTRAYFDPMDGRQCAQPTGAIG